VIDGLGAALTIDADWAGDDAIDHVARMLVDAQVKATWFVTNPGPAVDRLRLFPDLFELGAHPNFREGSTQGDSVTEVLAYCMETVPEARCVRMHGLMESAWIWESILRETPWRIDSTTFLYRYRETMPFALEWKPGRLVRVPFSWTDDVALKRLEVDGGKLSMDGLDLAFGAGARVVAFHPTLVAMNAGSWGKYLAVRGMTPYLHFPLSIRSEQIGVGDLFRSLLVQLVETESSVTMSELVERWEQGAAVPAVNG
jgi:hypothetical protein